MTGLRTEDWYKSASDTSEHECKDGLQVRARGIKTSAPVGIGEISTPLSVSIDALR